MTPVAFEICLFSDILTCSFHFPDKDCVQLQKAAAFCRFDATGWDYFLLIQQLTDTTA
jgi:hypothetical protein